MKESAVTKLLSFPRWLKVDAMDYGDTCVVVHCHSRRKNNCCPNCGSRSSKAARGRHVRHLLDMEVEGKTLRLEVTANKYACTNKSCPRHFFYEKLEGLACRYSRKTFRAGERIVRTSVESSAVKSSYLLSLEHIQASPSTCDRMILKARLPGCAGVENVGIDDFALKRGQRYGSVIVDQDSGRPIDMLPSRDAGDVRKWFEAHPLVKVATRDRGLCFKSGIAAANPAIVQVADRFHLMQNLGDKAMEYLLPRLKEYKSNLPPEPVLPTEKDAVRKLLEGRIDGFSTKKNRADLAAWQKVHILAAQGVPIPQMASRLGLTSVQVRKYEYARKGTYTTREQQRLSNDAGWIAYVISASGTWEPEAVYGKIPLFVRKKLRKEWICHLLNLFHGKEGKYKKAQGNTLKTYRQDKSEMSKMLFQKDYVCQTPYMAAFFDTKEADYATLIYLCRQFRELIKTGQKQFALDNWTRMAETSGFDFLESFAQGIRADFKAIQANKYTKLNNGILEGSVNRIKCIKRQMYGRASIDLLRHKVLLAKYG